MQDVFLGGEKIAVLEQAFGTRKYIKSLMRIVNLGDILQLSSNTTKGSS
jgi:hypothetical protein